MTSLLISRTETEAKPKEANQTKLKIDETLFEVSRVDQEAQKALTDALPMMERADDVVRKIDQNQYTNSRKINVTPAMGLEVAKYTHAFSNQDENDMES